ncbi:MAG TPA: YARHG domain-containing protein, partial [Ohtaekwangia sp.]|uniref:YARHG domain-containing protein n=1 Tax=Ohtaekwangia sp. TaxID=2066019 RepID=UPI002F91CA1E
TIGFDVPGLVEIKKNGKVGYFNLETQQQIVEPLYDMIIPYTADNSFALVKQDTLYGWIDHAFQYHEGFPSAAAEQLVDKYEFLPKNLVLKGDAKAFCEIPNQEYMGAGIIMPPSYMVTTGILSEIVSGISTAEVPLNAWTEYIATGSTMLESITDKIQAVVTTINERYIEGREEFYTYDRLVLVNHQHDTLAVSDINSSSKINFHKLNDTLLELQYESNQPEGSDFDEFNIPAYTYFRLNAGTAATPCTSHRRFPQSQFVKLDSSYLSGDFKRYTDKGEENVSFLSLATVTYIRNEILADYGYSFPGSEIAENYKYYKWYKPQFDKEEDLQDLLTEEDRHNLAFLAKIISLLQGGKAV